MSTKHNDISLSVINEPDISAELDSSIRETLVVCFPADREYYRNQSWWHCVPVYRVLAGDSKGVIVAHAAVVQRDVVVKEISDLRLPIGDCKTEIENRKSKIENISTVRVAGIQSFCVLPKYRGTGLSDKMMSVVMQEAKRRSFDAGLLFCLPQLEPVYGRMGWSRLDAAVYVADDKKNRKLIPAKNITMFYPLRIKQFPAGDIDLAGTDW